ncbi:hypothetical protein U1Q18_016767 [Sarracenia purpurea var. burkii]
MVRLGCEPRVCLPWTSRPSASVPRPSSFCSATLGLVIDSLFAVVLVSGSLVSPPMLDWGFPSCSSGFAADVELGFPSCSVRLRRLGWFNRDLGLLGTPLGLQVVSSKEKAELCVS